MGHLYCLENIRHKSILMNGRFGTIVTNDYDNIISKISNNLEKVYNCKFRKGIQVYFPAD